MVAVFWKGNTQLMQLLNTKSQYRQEIPSISCQRRKGDCTSLAARSNVQ